MLADDLLAMEPAPENVTAVGVTMKVRKVIRSWIKSVRQDYHLQMNICLRPIAVWSSIFLVLGSASRQVVAEHSQQAAN